MLSLKTNNSTLNNKKKLIENYKEKYSTIHEGIMKFQNNFLIDQHKKFKNDLDSLNIIFFFKKNFHEQILRNRINDIRHSLAYDDLWTNYLASDFKKIKTIDISTATGLPKETARRKVIHLVELKLLTFNKNKIYWYPEKKSQITKNKADKHLNFLTKLMSIVGQCIDIKVNLEDHKDELYKNYSFYSYHYFDLQLKYLNLWRRAVNDLDFFLISQELSINANSNFFKKNIDYANHFMNKKQKLSVKENSISATKISQITGITRATCMRKLDLLTASKIATKDFFSKKYFLNLGFDNLKIRKEVSLNEIDIFCDFFLKVFKALQGR